MRAIFVIITLLTLFGCSQNISKEDLRYLNGYWEIKEVKFPDGAIKEYKVNPTVDYIELDGLDGLRKKVRPRLNGTYFVSEDSENFTLRKKGDGFEMNYKNKMSNWTEKLTALSEDSFTVSNSENIAYTYHRFHSINVKANGETEK
ncbi:hypothetical protein K8352_08310 [Flavobacteriaceae bacterium F89]|uniref:Lipocalin-like domain-containing protein n=1 Tax=Cerina litoralis TaxID=2874477 RepID=A0AAE3ETM4_9FLAO|nr:hypothetical protein [Cerina litoralis]MCG2460748.1 hypothetical protein [Cerina litoralis]